jgi:hypothetical protein
MMVGGSRPLALRGRSLVALVLGLFSGLAAGCGSGTAAATGAGGMGAAGTSGTGAGGTGGGSGLPRCAVATRPQDHTNVDGAVPAMCNTVDFGGSWVTSEGAILGTDGTVTLDGGSPELPAGGTIADGDYDLVRETAGYTTRRSIRVFGLATYIEWVIENQDSSQDGGVIDVRFDTSAQATGTTLAISITCGDVNVTSGYGYTAAGDQLTLFYEGNPPGPMIFSVFVYRRTCAR